MKSQGRWKITHLSTDLTMGLIILDVHVLVTLRNLVSNESLRDSLTCHTIVVIRFHSVKMTGNGTPPKGGRCCR